MIGGAGFEALGCVPGIEVRGFVQGGVAFGEDTGGDIRAVFGRGEGDVDTGGDGNGDSESEGGGKDKTKGKEVGDQRGTHSEPKTRRRLRVQHQMKDERVIEREADMFQLTQAGEYIGPRAQRQKRS